jgi:hypothetical protein
MLGNAPTSLGQVVRGKRRLTVYPLEVFFTVDPDDCMVRVTRVKYVGT